MNLNLPFSPLLSERDAARIDAGAALADTSAWLSARQQAMLHRRGWLRMLAPRTAGGAELPFPDVVRLEEAVAAVDGSMAWVLTLCAGAGWFAGFMAPAMARTIIGSRRVCVAGSGAPTGFADIDDDVFAAFDGSDGGVEALAAVRRFRIQGRWDYASGAPMATHFTLNAVLRHRGQPLRDASGALRIRAFIVPAAMVTVEPVWRSIGLRASASHSYRIEGAMVDGTHGFRIDPAAASADGPLYRFPFMSLAYVTLAVNLSGMARHFLALATPAIGRRRQYGSSAGLLEAPAVLALLRAADAALAEARQLLYARLDAAWALVVAGTALSEADCAGLQSASRALAAAARAAVDSIYPLCGLAAASADSAINRVWRDFHTATQHSLFLPA